MLIFKKRSNNDFFMIHYLVTIPCKHYDENCKTVMMAHTPLVMCYKLLYTNNLHIKKS